MPPPIQTQRPVERLLATAARLFARHGINATGIDRILVEAGVAKMTLYNNFGSKEGFVLAVLDRTATAWRDWFAGALEALPGGPEERVLGMFGVLGGWFARDDFFGCPVMNAIAESDKDDARLRRLAATHEEALRSTIRDLVAGLDVAAADRDRLASTLVLLVRGAIAQATLARTADPARAAADAAKLLLSAMAPERRGAA